MGAVASAGVVGGGRAVRDGAARERVAGRTRERVDPRVGERLFRAARRNRRRGAARPPLSAWELGAALAGGYSGALLGGGGRVEARRRLGRFAVGLDLDGRYARGSLAGDDLAAGGLGVRAVGEARFAVARRVTLFVAAGAGAHWARVARTPPVGAVAGGNDGGPSLSASGGALLRVGPGLVTLAVGYAWTPLVANGLANLDGAMLSVGYRAARWRRRRARRRGGGGRRSARRRRRAPGT